MAAEATRAIERRAARLASARSSFEESIREGRRAGLSLRQLAAASGLSVERVRQIAGTEEIA